MSARKHEYDPATWRCIDCGTYVGDLIASSLPCRPEPVEDARPCDTERADVDYSAITRGIVG